MYTHFSIKTHCPQPKHFVSSSTGTFHCIDTALDACMGLGQGFRVAMGPYINPKIVIPNHNYTHTNAKSANEIGENWPSWRACRRFSLAWRSVLIEMCICISDYKKSAYLFSWARFIFNERVSFFLSACLFVSSLSLRHHISSPAVPPQTPQCPLVRCSAAFQTLW